MNARAIVLGALLIVPASTQGQPLDVASGSWVRIRAASLRQQHEAQVVSTSTDSMQFALDIGGPPLPLAIQDISFLEVRRERPHSKRRAITGMTVGAVLGAGVGALGALVVTSCQTTPTIDWAGGCGDAHYVEAAVGGAASGAVIGLFLGSIASMRVRWEVVINR